MSESKLPDRLHYRHHAPHLHLLSVFGDDWFAKKAEAFARFFGTSTFLLAQTGIVTLWIVLNVLGVVKFDLYPFILLNLAFSLQAAYAAPLILLAQTRQADRDKAHSDADAKHREEIAVQQAQHSLEMIEMMKVNISLTETIRNLSVKIAELTAEVHAKVTPQAAS